MKVLIADITITMAIWFNTQDFKNEVINLKGRLNLSRQLEVQCSSFSI